MRSFQHSGLERDWNIYKDQKRYVRNMLVQAKCQVIVTSIEDNRRNPKRFWRTLNVDLGLSDKKPKCCQGFSRVKNDSGVVVEGAEACSFMSNYYAQNGVKLASKFKRVDSNNINNNNNMNNTFVPHVTSEFDFNFIPLEVVRKLIREIEISKSSGVSLLSSRLLKDAFLVLVPELTHLFNESISTGLFPNTWRI